MPDLFNSPYSREEERYVGTVQTVGDSHLQRYGIVKAGSQQLTVQLDEGPYKGREVAAGNDLVGKMESDKMFAVGDRALVVLTVEDGAIISATAYDHYRLPIQLVLVAVLGLLLIAFTGISGAKALLSFVFAIVMMWKMLPPGILRGGDPIVIAFGIATLIAGVTLHLVAGVSRTAVTVWIGAMLGILLTAVLVSLFFPIRSSRPWSGSFGLVTVAPFTALCGGLLLAGRQLGLRRSRKMR